MGKKIAYLAIIGTASLFWLGAAVHAQVPRLIRYQGMLKDAQGVPLQGPYKLTFRLYAAQTGGAAMWTEPQVNVPVDGGAFSVLLGQVTPLDAMDWSAPCWLAMQVNADPELVPRQQITSVPLALRAETAEALTQPIAPILLSPQGPGSALDADTVDGKHASDLLDRAHHTGTQPASTITGTFPPSAVSPQGSGSGLDADTLDGQHASNFAPAGHTHALNSNNCFLTNQMCASGTDYMMRGRLECPTGYYQKGAEYSSIQVGCGLRATCPAQCVQALCCQP